MKEKEKIIFLPLKKGEQAKEYFGLSPVKTSFSDKHKDVSVKENAKKSKLPFKWYVFAFLIFILSLSSVILIQEPVQKKLANYNVSEWFKSIKNKSLTFFEKKPSIEKSESRALFLKDSIQNDSIRKAQELAAIKSQDSIKLNNKKLPYQVIIASFPTMDQVNLEIKKLKLDTTQIRILKYKNPTKFRISVMEFGDKDLAKEKLDSLKKVFNQNIWILSL